MSLEFGDDDYHTYHHLEGAVTSGDISGIEIGAYGIEGYEIGGPLGLDARVTSADISGALGLDAQVSSADIGGPLEIGGLEIGAYGLDARVTSADISGPLDINIHHEVGAYQIGRHQIGIHQEIGALEIGCNYSASGDAEYVIGQELATYPAQDTNFIRAMASRLLARWTWARNNLRRVLQETQVESMKLATSAKQVQERNAKSASKVREAGLKLEHAANQIKVSQELSPAMPQAIESALIKKSGDPAFQAALEPIPRQSDPPRGWDQHGGFYDEFGGYYDEFGGYYDHLGNYYRSDESNIE